MWWLLALSEGEICFGFSPVPGLVIPWVVGEVMQDLGFCWAATVWEINGLHIYRIPVSNEAANKCMHRRECTAMADQSGQGTMGLPPVDAKSGTIETISWMGPEEGSVRPNFNHDVNGRFNVTIDNAIIRICEAHTPKCLYKLHWLSQTLHTNGLDR